MPPLLPLLLLWLAARASASSSERQRTFAKAGELFLRSCDSGADLFREQDPRDWPACGDALEFTWTDDAHGFLSGLSASDRTKLGRSNGFCPQLRCQLGNVSNADSSGACPKGLCYSKLENGALSFGACCFTDGAFAAPRLVGYFDKSQPAPKPIYRLGRVVLGPDKADESRASFINANEVFPGVVATQCPLLNPPEGHADTLEDALLMVLEQRLSLWVSLAPVMLGENATIERMDAMLAERRACNAFPLALMRRLGGSLQPSALGSSAQYLNLSYTVRGYLVDGRAQLERPSEGAAWTLLSQRVEHLWYLRWQDFAVPPPEDEALVAALAARAQRHLAAGARLAVSCGSGRGRSGTFAGVVAALHSRAASVSAVVDVVVDMRRARDGLVETPEQFRLLVRLLGLGDTAACGASCSARRAAAAASASGAVSLLLGAAIAVALLCVLSEARDEGLLGRDEERDPLLGARGKSEKCLR